MYAKKNNFAVISEEDEDRVEEPRFRPKNHKTVASPSESLS
jgi:hypothetical protein